MNGPMTITIGGTTYNVCVDYDSIKRSFEVLEGPNSGTSITGKSIRDILGVNVNYSMTIKPNPAYPAQYDNLVAKLATPSGWTADKTISAVFPYGQGTQTINCKIESFSDSYKGYHNGYKRWDALDITLSSNAPVFS